MPRTHLTPLPLIPDDPIAIAAVVAILGLIVLGAQANEQDCHQTDQLLRVCWAREPEFTTQLEFWHAENA